jgi:cell division protein FtsL
MGIIKLRFSFAEESLMKKKINIKTVVLVVLLFYVGILFVNQRISARKINQEMIRQNQELAKVKDVNQQLQDEVSMSKDDSYMEKLARERLSLVKDGEIPVIHSSNSNKKK